MIVWLTLETPNASQPCISFMKEPFRKRGWWYPPVKPSPSGETRWWWFAILILKLLNLKTALHFQVDDFQGSCFFKLVIYIIVIYYIVIYIISHLILMPNFQYIHSFNDFFHRPHPPKGLVDHQRLGVRMARVPFLTWKFPSIQQLSIRMSLVDIIIYTLFLGRWILRVRKIVFICSWKWWNDHGLVEDD